MKTEAQIKQTVKNYLNSLGEECIWFMPQAGIYGRKGVSDFIVCYKGRLIAIECKKECGTERAVKLLSPSQKDFLRRVALSKGDLFIIHSDLSMRGMKSYFNCHSNL